MRPAIAALALFAIACSSKAGGPVLGAPVAATSIVPPIASSNGARPPSTPSERVHVVRLPDQPWDELVPTVRSLDWAAGTPPGAEFPEGTMYVVTQDQKVDEPVTVTEWDLARSTVVHRVELPVPMSESHPWMIRVGDQLRVVVQGWDSISLVLLGKDLQVEHVEHASDTISQPGIEVVSADAKLTAVAYPGPISLERGLVVTTFDASGRRIASRNLQRFRTVDRSTVVLEGRVFALVSEFDKGVDLVALRPDLTEERRVRISRAAEGGVELVKRNGRLEVTTGWGSQATEFSARLERLGPVDPTEDRPFVALGDEKVHLCSNGQERRWLAWTATGEDPCKASPAELLERSAPEH